MNDIIKTILILGVIIFLYIFIHPLIYNLSGRNCKRLFKWVRVTLITSTILSLIIICISTIINKSNYQHITIYIGIFCLILDVIILLMIALVNCINKKKRNYGNEILLNKLLFACTIVLILAPILIIIDIIYLIFPNLFL